jgi:hypothetical protein
VNLLSSYSNSVYTRPPITSERDQPGDVRLIGPRRAGGLPRSRVQINILQSGAIHMPNWFTGLNLHCSGLSTRATLVVP